MAQVRVPVTPTVIRQIVRQIVARFHPQKVILFGSYAYGQPHEDSDLDFLIIMPDPPSPQERWRESVELSQAFALPIQLVFMDPEEFEETKDVVGGLAYPAYHWGKSQYDADT